VRYLFNFNYAQCTQANHRFNRSDCCTNPGSNNCDRTSAIADVGNYLASKQGINSTHVWGKLSWASMTAEIGTRGKPFLIRVGWGGSLTNGHVFVGRAYSWHDAGTDQFSVMDPSDATYKWYSWAYFNNNSTFTWSNTLWKLNR
jgi:hypothetical protein